MSHVDVIRAWKDEAYRLSLSDAERAALPANPAGLIELVEAELEGVAGGAIRPTRNWRCIHTRRGCFRPRTNLGTGGSCTKCAMHCG